MQALKEDVPATTYAGAPSESRPSGGARVAATGPIILLARRDRVHLASATDGERPGLSAAPGTNEGLPNHAATASNRDASGPIAQSVELRTFKSTSSTTAEDSRDVTSDEEDESELSRRLPPRLPPRAAAFEGDAVDAALAQALQAASEVGRWDVVSTLAAELQARRQRAEREPAALIDLSERRRR